MTPRSRAASAVAALVLIGVAASLGGCWPLFNNRCYDNISSARKPIDIALNEFHAAAANADFDRYFSRWTDTSVFLGTDATERWTGQEFRDFARPHFDKSKGGKGWTYHPRSRVITVIDGDDVFFDELLDHDKLGECRGSGVLSFRDGRWMVMQYNLSIPIPNALAEEFAGRIKKDAAK